MTTITFLIEDSDYRKVEKHKWNTRDWENVERTWSYLRKKYGSFIDKHLRPVNPPEENKDNWVSD